VSRGMSVIDTSPGHDWTSVAVVHTPSGTHGADYPTYGYVHPRPAQPEIIEAHDRSGSASYAAYEGPRPVSAGGRNRRHATQLPSGRQDIGNSSSQGSGRPSYAQGGASAHSRRPAPQTLLGTRRRPSDPYCPSAEPPREDRRGQASSGLAPRPIDSICPSDRMLTARP
jgi:hypothetical protein